MRLQKLLPEYDWVGPPDSGASAVVCTTADAVYRATQQNYPAENVFFLNNGEKIPVDKIVIRRYIGVQNMFETLEKGTEE